MTLIKFLIRIFFMIDIAIFIEYTRKRKCCKVQSPFHYNRYSLLDPIGGCRSMRLAFSIQIVLGIAMTFGRDVSF